MSESQPNGGPGRLPRWLETTASWAWRLLVLVVLVIVVLWVVARIRIGVIPALIALVVATALHRPISWFEGKRVPRALAALCLVIGLLGGVAGLLWFVGSEVQSDFGSRDLDEVTSRIEEWLMENPFNLSESQIESARESARQALVGGAQSVGATEGVLVLNLLGGAILTLVLTVMFASDGRTMWRWFVTRIPRDRRATVDRMGREAATTVAAYVRNLLLAGIFDAVLIGLGLLVLGVPLWLPLAALTLVAALFPVIGAFVSGLAAALVALVTVGPTTALWVVLLALVVQQIEGNLFVPYVVGRTVPLHPSIILIALAVGGAAAGLAGAFLAVPLLAASVAAISVLADASD